MGTDTLVFTAQNAPPDDQFDFALMWNRADIARTEIFTKDQKLEVWTYYTYTSTLKSVSRLVIDVTNVFLKPVCTG